MMQYATKPRYILFKLHFIFCFLVKKRRRTEAPIKGGRGRQNHRKKEEAQQHHHPKRGGGECSTTQEEEGERRRRQRPTGEGGGQAAPTISWEPSGLHLHSAKIIDVFVTILTFKWLAECSRHLNREFSEKRTVMRHLAADSVNSRRSARRSAVLPNGGTSGRRVAQGSERLGQAADVRCERRRIPRLSLQFFSNPHEPCQFNLTDADGQMRSRTNPDLPGSSESARRSIFEMLCTEVLLVSFDFERKCGPWSALLRNPLDQRHGV